MVMVARVTVVTKWKAEKNDQNWRKNKLNEYTAMAKLTFYMHNRSAPEFQENGKHFNYITDNQG